MNLSPFAEVLIFCFPTNIYAAEPHKLLSNIYFENVIVYGTGHEWFRSFNNCDIDVGDEHGGVKRNIFENREFEFLLNKNFWKSQGGETIAGRDITKYFKTSQSHGRDSKITKISYVPVETKSW